MMVYYVNFIQMQTGGAARLSDIAADHLETFRQILQSVSGDDKKYW